MGFRFRKIIPLGKGFRLNLSKSGISGSIGKPGTTLNIGANGVRPTVGIPGTGMSFTPSKSSKSNKGGVQSGILISVVIWILICLGALCLGLVLILFNSSDPPIPTSTPEAKIPIEQLIVMTANMAQTQTMIYAPPSSTPPILDTPTMLPPVTLVPTWTSAPTETPWILATLPQQPQSAVCSCAGDTLNCNDFSSHTSAQACFNYCVSQGRGDIHNLDQDGNGSACESLP